MDPCYPAVKGGHALAFETLGGVARRILYGNLKSVVVERVGEHIRFHPQIPSTLARNDPGLLVKNDPPPLRGGRRVRHVVVVRVVAPILLVVLR